MKVKNFFEMMGDLSNDSPRMQDYKNQNRSYRKFMGR